MATRGRPAGCFATDGWAVRAMASRPRGTAAALSLSKAEAEMRKEPAGRVVEPEVKEA
jgi:hypothetical protein